MAAHAFQLVGGSPVLDFLNTIHDWTAPKAHDYLADFGEARRFGAAAGLVTAAEAAALGGTGGELARLVALRALLERIFRALVTGRSPGAADLSALDGEAARAAGAARLRGGRRGVRRLLDPAAAGAALLRWRLAEAAVALLTSPQLALVKACPSCGWFFLDTTKNHSRRWCSMAMCGSSAKARRYYQRRKRRSR